MGRKNQAYDYLKNAIIQNELPPGTPLREMELSEKLNMSRSPIREALRELEIEGVVISYPSRGTIVTPITPSDVEEIYELRSLFEVWALEQGFHRFSIEELNLLQESFTKAYQEHSEIIKAIQSNDLAKSKAALKKHLRSVSNSAIETARMIDMDFM